MMGDNKSEKFFKVLHDRMKEAQTDIKATVSVSVGEMTYKANEKELESGKAPGVTCLYPIAGLRVNYRPPSRPVQSSLTRVIPCWSKASRLPPSQAPPCCPCRRPQSRRRWRRRWAQL